MSLNDILPPLNRMLAYIDIAQKKGAFTLKQSSDLYQQIQAIQKVFSDLSVKKDQQRENLAKRVHFEEPPQTDNT